MAIRTVLTRGYGNGTFNGTIALAVTRGYATGPPGTPPVAGPGAVLILLSRANNGTGAVAGANKTGAVKTKNSVTTY